MNAMLRTQFIITYCCLSCIVAGCIKDNEGSTGDTYFINSTRVSVKVVPYFGGNIYSDFEVFLNVAEEARVLQSNQKGKGSGLSYATKVDGMDSILVIYNEQDTAVHYSYQTSQNTKNISAVKYDDPRSLYREENYDRSIKTETKKYLENIYRYTFTEEDFLRAHK